MGTRVFSTMKPISGTSRHVLILVVSLQTAQLALAHVAMVREVASMKMLRPIKLWSMYISVLMCYASFYFLIFALSRESFVLMGYEADKEEGEGKDAEPVPSPSNESELSNTTVYNDSLSVYIFLLYFSATIITSTGFGDIFPVEWHSEMTVNSQMLIAMIYHSGVFGISLHHFLQQQKHRKRLQDAEDARIAAMKKRQQERELRRRRRELMRQAARRSMASSSCVSSGMSTPRMRLVATPADAAAGLAHAGDFPSSVDSHAMHGTPLSSDSEDASHHPHSSHPSLLSSLHPAHFATPRLSREQSEEVHFEPHSPYPMSSSDDSSDMVNLAAISSLPAQVSSTEELAQTLAPDLHIRAPDTVLPQMGWWLRLKQSPGFERLRRWVLRYLLLVALALQILAGSLMFLLRDPFTGLNPVEGSNYYAKIAVLVLACLLLLVQLVLNTAISLRLLNKIAGGTEIAVLNSRGEVVTRIPKQTVSGSFLAQSYISTILVFSSLYFFIFAFMPTHEFSISKHFDVGVVETWWTFLYFSTTCMSGTGFGDIYARGVLSRLSDHMHTHAQWEQTEIRLRSKQGARDSLFSLVLLSVCSVWRASR